MPTVTKKLDAGAFQLKDQVVAINRVTKVVKGGKNLSFAALIALAGSLWMNADRNYSRAMRNQHETVSVR